MKKNLSFFSLIFIVLLLILTACRSNHSSDYKPVHGDNTLVEEKLPVGVPVIDDDDYISGEKGVEVMFGNDDNATDNKSSVTIPEDKQGYYKRKFKSLLVFHADDSMIVNNPRLATLVLGRDQTIDKLKVEVLEESNAKDDKITSDTAMEFGSKMKAKLIPFGDSKENTFEIEALGDDIQSFRAERNKIIWQWKITPLKAGKQELKLSVQIIEKDGEAVMLPAKNIIVEIYAKNESFFQKLGGFFERKWEFLLTAIMIPIIIAWFTTRLKNKANKPAPAAAPPAD